MKNKEDARSNETDDEALEHLLELYCEHHCACFSMGECVVFRALPPRLRRRVLVELSKHLHEAIDAVQAGE